MWRELCAEVLCWEFVHKCTKCFKEKKPFVCADMICVKLPYAVFRWLRVALEPRGVSLRWAIARGVGALPLRGQAIVVLLRELPGLAKKQGARWTSSVCCHPERCHGNVGSETVQVHPAIMWMCCVTIDVLEKY